MFKNIAAMLTSFILLVVAFVVCTFIALVTPLSFGFMFSAFVKIAWLILVRYAIIVTF